MGLDDFISAILAKEQPVSEEFVPQGFLGERQDPLKIEVRIRHHVRHGHEAKTQKALGIEVG